MAKRKTKRPSRISNPLDKITVNRGFTEYGPCYEFHHQRLGYLGRIVIMQVNEQQTMVRVQATYEDKDNHTKTKLLREIGRQINESVLQPMSNGCLSFDQQA